MNESHDVHQHGKLKGLLWIVGGVFLASIFAFGLPRLGRFIPWAWENRLGEASSVRR